MHFTGTKSSSELLLLLKYKKFSARMDLLTDKLATTIVPTKSDSDAILCLPLLSKTLTCTPHLSKHESIDHLCINPILQIGLIHK